MVHADTLLSPEELSTLWADLAGNDQLPDWYELTEHGELIMSPRPETRHQRLCTQIALQLQAQLGGEAVVEAAVLTTTAGIRVPDVIWMPESDWQKIATPDHLLEAPPLVVEVLSPGNRQKEINHKTQAYLKSGVQEVILIGLTGTIQYVRQDGLHATSMFNLNLALSSKLFSSLGS
jgi:Uma2 family endonuclease